MFGTGESPVPFVTVGESLLLRGRPEPATKAESGRGGETMPPKDVVSIWLGKRLAKAETGCIELGLVDACWAPVMFCMDKSAAVAASVADRANGAHRCDPGSSLYSSGTSRGRFIPAVKGPCESAPSMSPDCPSQRLQTNQRVPSEAVHRTSRTINSTAGGCCFTSVPWPGRTPAGTSPFRS